MRGSWQKQVMEVQCALSPRKRKISEGITQGTTTARWVAALLLAAMAAIVMCGAPMAFAQSSTGQIKGVVTDPTGAVIPGAVVTAISLDNGFTRTVNSGRDGSFLIPELDPQHYKVQVSAPGFKKLERGPITVQVTETADLGPVPLSIGEQTMTVVVDTQAELLNTENATLGKVFDSTMIEAMPLSTRNFTQLLGLQAGVIGSIPDTLTFGNGGNAAAGYSVGGGTENSVNIDGVSATSSATGNISVPSPDALAEFKMQTSTYSAEYGRANGGSIDVTTKTGTNQFHGDGFYFFRNKALDANLYFNKQTELASGQPNVPPDLRQNQFGGTVGGPVLRNKLFFFFSYQETKQVNGNAGFFTNDNYPLLPSGDRTDTGTLEKFLGATYGGEAGLFGGETVAADGSNVNPVALKLIQAKFANGNYVLPYVPAKDVTGAGRTNVAQFVWDYPDLYRERQYLGNVDYKLSPRQTLSTKYFNSHSLVSEANGTIPGFTADSPSISENAIITHNFVITSSLVNEFKVGFLRQVNDYENNNGGLTASDIGMLQTPDAHNNLPSLIFALPGLTFPNSQISTQTSTENQYSLSDVVSKTKGRHNMRFGGTVMQHQLYLDLTRAGAIITYNMADLLIGEDGVTNGSGLSNLLVTTESSGSFKRFYTFKDVSPFFQDDFKIRRDLTLNLGLRYDYFAWPTETKGLLDNFVPSQIGEGLYGIPNASQQYSGYTISQKFKQLNPSFALPTGVQQVNNQLGLTPNYKNFAPRLGFAYSPRRDLSIRGGFGLFFTRENTGIATAVIQGFPFNEVAFYSFGSQGTLQDPFSHLNLPPDSAYPLYQPRTYGPTTTATNQYDAAAPILRNPYTEQFNLSVQQDFGHDFLLEIAYQGSNGVKLLQALSQNQPGIASAANPIRGITNNLRLADTCNSNFCAVQDQTNTGSLNVADRTPVAGVLGDEGLLVSQTSASSHFNALEFTLSKRMSHGLQLLSAFTWSKAMSSAGGDGPYDNNNTHHMFISGGDRTLRFTTSAVYQLGNILKNPNRNFAVAALNRTVGQWTMATSITAQSGTPIGFQFANTTVGASGLKIQTNLTYSLIPGATINQIKGHGPTRNRLNNYFNTGNLYNTNPLCGDQTKPCSFLHEQIAGYPTGGQYGPNLAPNCGPKTVGDQYGPPSVFVCPGAAGFDPSFGSLPPVISSIRNPGQKTVDFSLTKKLPIYKNYSLEFRADAFNLFNWAEFAGPDAGPGDVTFGLINNTTVEPRVLQVAAKVKF
jgi:hypothetical protein